MSPRRQEQIHLYDYFIDEEGNWFCEGNLVADRELFRLLSRALFVRQDRHYVRCEGEVHPVRVADAPLWVRYVHITSDCPGRLLHVDIELMDGRREPLRADTLTVAGGERLYCRSTRQGLKTRFAKAAYYELTRHLHHDTLTDCYYFLIGHRRFDIRSEGETDAG
jgi:hypothetical protein